MSKRLTAFLCILLATWIVMGCGNKGDLFLPADPQLARELEAAGERINNSDVPTAEEDATDKQKRQTIKPPQ